MKNKLAMLGLMAGMFIGAGGITGYSQPEPLTQEEKEKIRSRNRKIKLDKEIKRRTNQGQTMYEYGSGKFIWARNKNNADRKAKNKGWI